jgi:hypothetical protein
MKLFNRDKKKYLNYNLGSIYAALRIYHRTLARKSLEEGEGSSNSKRLKNNSSHQNKTHNNKHQRPTSLNYDRKSNKKSLKSLNSNLSGGSGGASGGGERDLLMSTIASEQAKNLPAEELLELGLNYLHQAIKSWETALDSIEDAAYMQSNTLALPVSFFLYT